MSKNQKIFRRVLTIFLALILVLGCVAMIAPYVVSADDGDIDFDDLIAAGRGGYCGENATWKLNGRGVLTIGGTGAMDLNGNDAPWYSYRDEIVAIVVENGVTAIDDSSFMNLFEVTSVSLGKDVKSIGEYAFNCCTKLKSLTIPDSVKTIAEEAFGYCEGLRSVVIGNGVEEIEGWAFVGCLTLETVTIGSGYAAFEPDAFEMCPSLESVTFAATNTAYTSVNGAVYSKDKTALVYIPSGITGKFEILSTVAEIEKGALNDCYGLDSLTIPASVKKIERQSGGEMGIVETIYYEGNASTWDKVEKIECEEFFQDRLVFFSRMSITSQPKNAAAPSGSKATTKITATGEGLKYAWYIKNKGATTWSKSSLTGTEYYVTMKSTTNGRQVYCLVTDKYGNTVKSDVVTLHMGNPAKITTQPKSMTVQDGKQAKTTLKATGDGLKYTWYFKNKGAASFSKSSLTGTSYYVTMKAACDGRQVYCVVTDKYGTSVKSSVVTLSMVAKPKITTQPANNAAANGKTVTTTVKATGEGLKYTWYYKNPGASSYTKSSSTTATYSTTMKSAANGRQVYCVVTDKYGQTVKSNVATLYMGTPVKITTQPKNAVAGDGKTVTTTLKATGTGLKYTWYFKNASATAYSKSSVTTATYTTAMAAAKNGRTVYCVVTDKYGISVKSNVV
ncbi:MAG: leucine-rich repeat domain-containing protein, partial [Oscillospiraceae bacterium]|nr:leucine-rich repeat domain-containing protein [Oscillospiraceae bacterium]